ncbi:MAG TPA: CHASE3 domain-containing protein [Burkholderiales bacterium]|nr:CHASE3 domain-containing protein [Burkholderiales bacterium]
MKLSPNLRLFALLLLALTLSVGVVVLSERTHRRLGEANQQIAGSTEAQATASELLALVIDAETAQRGLLLTQRPEYLEPYVVALPQIRPKLARLRELTAGATEVQAHVDRLGELLSERFSELDASLVLYRDRGPKAALELMRTDFGRRSMDRIRGEVDAIQRALRTDLIERHQSWNRDVAFSRLGLAIIAGLNVALLLLVYVQARREILWRERQRRSLVEQRRLLEEQVQERTAQLSELSSNLQNVQEAEKAKLARDIHDELGSILVSARMDVSWARRRVEPLDPAAAEKLARASSTLDEGVEIKRRIIEDLRPTLLDNLGLAAALNWHVNQACERGGLACNLSLPEEDLEVPSPVSIALFRVVQEALTNVLRYAKARNVWLSVEHTETGISLALRDDGVGIAPRALGDRLSHGIVGMRQRIASLGGTFRIGRVAQGGTAIEVFVPLHGRDAPADDEGAPVGPQQAESIPES